MDTLISVQSSEYNHQPSQVSKLDLSVCLYVLHLFNQHSFIELPTVYQADTMNIVHKFLALLELTF